MKRIRNISWALAIIAFIVLVAMSLPNKKGDENTSTPMPIAGFNKGTHFLLTDHNGSKFDSKSSIKDGQYALIFFGFTHCPVICPTELQKFSIILDDLPTDTAKKIKTLFITIDPERDTVESLKDYVPLFHENIIGLTGSVKNIHGVLDSWKVYYSKVEDPQYTEYTMDHSTYSYLVDGDMNIVAMFRMKNTADEIVEQITKIVQ